MKLLLLFITVFLLLIVTGAAENSSSVRIDADIPSIPIYIDDTYAGTTPVEVSGLVPGYHLVSASPEGYLYQTQNISIGGDKTTDIFFTFGSPDHVLMPAMVRIGDCVGTPEPSELEGIAYDLVKLPDGRLMAYYSGWDEGIKCMVSSDGITWSKAADSCFLMNSSELGLQTEPWVFSLPNGGYNMIFRQTEGMDYQFYTAHSPDGIHFSDRREIAISGNNSDDHAGEELSFPSGITYPNGTLRMYYNSPETGIKSAFSEDQGISWRIEDGNRVIFGNDPVVLLLPDGRTGMFYIDIKPKFKGQRIFFSVSDDGLDFSKYKPVPILETTQPGVWLMDPEIEEEEGNVMLYFSVMGADTNQNQGLPGILRSIVNINCLLDHLSESD
ncbi:MAG: PEGA domain-containing protein [Methanospirillum sp.]|nr:PEGA domain-containing protein [Methanospirillum sp.]